MKKKNMINYFLITFGNIRSLINIVIIRKHTQHKPKPRHNTNEWEKRVAVFEGQTNDEKEKKIVCMKVHKTLQPMWCNRRRRRHLHESPPPAHYFINRKKHFYFAIKTASSLILRMQTKTSAHCTQKWRKKRITHTQSAKQECGRNTKGKPN